MLNKILFSIESGVANGDALIAFKLRKYPPSVHTRKILPKAGESFS